MARLRFLAENEDITTTSATAKEGNPHCSHDAHGFASFKRQCASNWIDLAMAILCVLGAALASGLTVGLISTDRLELEIKQRVGTPAEQWQAKRLLPILRHKHLLLVSLVLFNAAAAEALPLFLDGLVPTYMAILIRYVSFHPTIHPPIFPSTHPFLRPSLNPSHPPTHSSPPHAPTPHAHTTV